MNNCSSRVFIHETDVHVISDVLYILVEGKSSHQPMLSSGLVCHTLDSYSLRSVVRHHGDASGHRPLLLKEVVFRFEFSCCTQ